jgi:murein DD-endopeptidase MepM/ murein hydrolase activator NlpD
VVRKSRQPQQQPPAAQASAATPASTPGRRERVIQGTIRGSLYKALRTQGGTPQMAHDLVEILTWDVDFQTDVRAGDRFHLLIEERSRHGKFTYHRILAAELGNKQRRVQAVYYPPQEEDGAYYRPNGQSLRRMFLSAPVRYTRISSAFSYSRRHPVLNTYRPHLGIDYAAPTGTPVRSVGDGVITWAGMKGGGGKTVEIRHDGTYSTYYLHLSRIASTVQVGRSVSQGQVIGYVGATGLATGPHLDFRIAKNGTFLNPLTQQDVAAPALARESLAAFRAYSQRLLTKLHASSSGNKE